MRSVRPGRPCHSCETCETRSEGVFEVLEGLELDRLNRSKVTNVYRRGQTLFHEGNPCAGVFCIRSGLVKISRAAPRNRRHILYLAGPAEVLGLESVLTGEPHSSTAEMAEDGVVCLIDRGEVQQFMRERTEVCRAIAETMAQQLLRCEDERVELAGGDVRERLAATLLNLATRFGEEEDEATRIALQLSREELAEMIGASTETTIRQLSEFREQGIVSNSGRRIRLDDADRLARIARVSNGQAR